MSDNKPITEAELTEELQSAQSAIDGGHSHHDPWLVVRLIAEVRRLRAEYESKCKCGNRKAPSYSECESCYIDGVKS